MRRIGFDAVRALRNSTGLGNYARRVLAGILAPGSGVEGYLYSPAPARPEFRGVPAELGARLKLPGGVWRARGLGSLWRTFQLGRAAAADGVQLFHGLSHEIPRDLPRALPAVVSFLDLLWERYPGLYPPIDRRSYAWRYRWSADNARVIVAISRQTRHDLIAGYGVEPRRIVVIPPPGDPRFAQPVAETLRRATLQRLELPERFLLSVGTLEPRKNQRTAVAALARLDPAHTPPLVLLGRDGGSRSELVAQAARLGVADRVLIRSEVGAAELPAVMQSAAVFLYPSLAEGFGLPIVEAESAGVPVIASEAEWAREAGGPAARYVPATDAQALAAGLREILDDPTLAETMRSAGRRHAGGFDPGLLAARLIAVYDAVLGGGPLPEDVGSPSGRERH